MQAQPQMSTVQPGFVPATAIPGQANVVVVTQVVQRPPKDWTFGLFDCFGDCGSCCLAMFCPCIVYGKNKQSLNKSDGCGGDCCIYCITNPCCSACVGAGGRASIRSKFNITGDGCSDCMAHWCCMPCALTQEKREIDAMIAAGMN
ncbi:PLAC8 family-domain-containing protein [Fimicolochytrium jonesii]|uniref:PLAC8 family-domain-containing protein n=1 Tax=Fimicolochytrium jonesii TaxID=1396493 RepID=UPI0022FE41D8|nr:PLAC8 family-domain-containing protein [Fimicolochytrium jonesii]KAI8816952.1 PLAC8 family-domain-containing protein [Fimicolochytrium jonesii]